jgi:hypothetical protein
VTLRYELILAGALPRPVAEVIRSRFGEVVLRSERDATVMTGDIVDQPALRALLSLVWDTGGHVMSLEITPVHPSRRT